MDLLPQLDEAQDDSKEPPTNSVLGKRKEAPTTIPNSPMKTSVRVKKEKTGEKLTAPQKGDHKLTSSVKDEDKEKSQKDATNEVNLVNFKDFIKSREHIPTVDLTKKTKINLYCRDTANKQLTLIGIEKAGSGKDPEIGTITDSITSNTKADKQFMKENSMVAIVARRKCKNLNEPIVLTCPAWGTTYTDKYFVVIKKPNQTNQDVLQTFQRVSICSVG